MDLKFSEVVNILVEREREVAERIDKLSSQAQELDLLYYELSGQADDADNEEQADKLEAQLQEVENTLDVLEAESMELRTMRETFQAGIDKVTDSNGILDTFLNLC